MGSQLWRHKAIVDLFPTCYFHSSIFSGIDSQSTSDRHLAELKLVTDSEVKKVLQASNLLQSFVLLGFQYNSNHQITI